MINNVVFDDTVLRCGSWNLADLSPGSVQSGQVMGAERRDLAPSRDGSGSNT